MATRPNPRTERAQATRRRIIEAAFQLFSERGYGVPLSAIASRAGVAVQTVRFVFHDKPSLLRAVLTERVVGAAGGVAPDQQPWMEAVRAEPDVHRALRSFAEGSLGIFERVGPLVGLFQSGQEEVAPLWAHSEQLRRDGFAKVLDLLISKRTLRPGLSREYGLDLFFELISPGLYFTFVHSRGWSRDEWLDVTVPMVGGSLFGE
jgi:AcrR family transcriptional regulator